jgi:hypothetical protein
MLEPQIIAKKKKEKRLEKSTKSRLWKMFYFLIFITDIELDT